MTQLQTKRCRLRCGIGRLLKDKTEESDCLNLLAVIFIRLTDYKSAAIYAKKCYVLDEKSGDPDMMSSSLNSLAAIYMSANQPKEAEKYILMGLEAAAKADNPSRRAVLLGMASEVAFLCRAIL